jgi:hypothetical protein
VALVREARITVVSLPLVNEWTQVGRTDRPAALRVGWTRRLWEGALLLGRLCTRACMLRLSLVARKRRWMRGLDRPKAGEQIDEELG